jgi:hypothetical protein
MVKEFVEFRMNWNTGGDCSGNRNLKIYCTVEKNSIMRGKKEKKQSKRKTEHISN